MASIRAENYDGRKAYIGDDEYHVIREGNKKFLVKVDGPQSGVIFVEPKKVYRIMKEIADMDAAEATEVKDRKVISRLVEICKSKGILIDGLN